MRLKRCSEAKLRMRPVCITIRQRETTKASQRTGRRRHLHQFFAMTLFTVFGQDEHIHQVGEYGVVGDDARRGYLVVPKHTAGAQ